MRAILASIALALGVAASAEASLQELLEKAASAEGTARQEAIGIYLDALPKAKDLSVAEQLKFAWYGYFLADDDAERLKVLEFATNIPSPDARMILFGLTDQAAIEKQVTAGQKKQDAALSALPDAKKDKAGRVSFGQNAYDKMALYERFETPPAWVGRWSGGGVELDVNAFPSQTIAGRIRWEEDGKAASANVVGWEVKGSPRVLGPGWTADWKGDHFVLSGHGREEVLKRVAVGTTGKEAPAGAVVIFNGKDMKALNDKKGGDAQWKITPEGFLEIPPGVGDHRTRESFGDVRLYLEYRQAFNRDGINRKRGNGGVYLQSNYEIQLTDNFGNDVNEALSGAIYHISTPTTNMSAPPMEWGSLEVEFYAPRYDSAGKKTTEARMTVWQNGVKIHDNVELPKVTGGAKGETGDPLPINIQAHGGLLQFRNIWAQPLASAKP